MLTLIQSETFQRDFAESVTEADLERLIERHKHKVRVREGEAKLEEARKGLEQAEKEVKAASEELEKAIAAVARSGKN